MRTIEIDNELFLVEVPKDAVNFELIESHNYFKSPRIEHSIGGFDLDRKFDYEIIGLIEAPNLEFDFEVDESWVKGFTLYVASQRLLDNGKQNRYVYENYLDVQVPKYTKKQSFRTRIQSKIQDAGLYLVNPICNPFYIKQIGENMRTSTYIADWQFKEEKTIKGNLLLIKKLK